MSFFPIVDERRVEEARADAVVQDESGHEYVAIHPGYTCASKGRYNRVLGCRIGVCIMTAVVDVLLIVGQLVPYMSGTMYDEDDASGDGYRFGATVWTVWSMLGDISLQYQPSVGEAPAQVAVTFASVLTLICVVMTAVYAALWARNESRRCVEAIANLHVLAEYGRARPGEVNRPLDPCSYANRRVENHRLVANVPLEQRELRRRTVDHVMGVFIFSLLLVSAALVIVTVALLAYVFSYDQNTYGARLDVGIVILSTALLVYIIAVVLVAVPSVCNLHLCHTPQLIRCALMVASDEDEMNDMPPASQLREQAAMNYDGTATGPNVLMPGVAQGIPIALPAPPVDSLRAVPSTSGAPQGRSSPMTGPPTPEGCYESSVYYQAPPPLFNIRSDAVAAAAGACRFQEGDTVE